MTPLKRMDREVGFRIKLLSEACWCSSDPFVNRLSAPLEQVLVENGILLDLIKHAERRPVVVDIDLASALDLICEITKRAERLPGSDRSVISQLFRIRAKAINEFQETGHVTRRILDYIRHKRSLK